MKQALKTLQKPSRRALFLREGYSFTPKKGKKPSKTPPAVDYRGTFRKKKYAAKEPDPETGLYYYGARYLDPKTSRWLSGDSALGEYFPVAPVSDDAKKHNQSLPGMGGVFNTVNMHAYHYAGNNPVKYVDPDGREIDGDSVKQLFDYTYQDSKNNQIIQQYSYKNAVCTNLIDLKEDGSGNVTTIITTKHGRVEVSYEIGKGGAITFDHSTNNYRGVIDIRGRKLLARAMFDASRFINPESLSGRTVKGIDIELHQHYQAYKHLPAFMVVTRKRATIADMGGMDNKKPGHDGNAWIFECLSGIVNFFSFKWLVK